MKTNTIAEWVKAARQSKKLTQTQLGEALGRTKQNIYSWEKGIHEPSPHQIKNIMTLTGAQAPSVYVDIINTSALNNGFPNSPPNATRAPYIIEMSDTNDKGLEIPYYRVKGSCGGGNDNPLPEIKGTISREAAWFSRYKVKAKNCIAIYAHGDSMQPYIMDGDMVILDTSQTEPQSGNVYLINHPDGERLKRLRREMDGGWVLESDNLDKKRYPDERISSEHADLMKIIGCVFYRQG